MYKVEEIKNKIRLRQWNKDDVAGCVDELKKLSALTEYVDEIYAIWSALRRKHSYTWHLYAFIFALAFRLKSWNMG